MNIILLLDFGSILRNQSAFACPPAEQLTTLKHKLMY